MCTQQRICTCCCSCLRFYFYSYFSLFFIIVLAHIDTCRCMRIGVRMFLFCFPSNFCVQSRFLIVLSIANISMSPFIRSHLSMKNKATRSRMYGSAAIGIERIHSVLAQFHFHTYHGAGALIRFSFIISSEMRMNFVVFFVCVLQFSFALNSPCFVFFTRQI